MQNMLGMEANNIPLQDTMESGGGREKGEGERGRRKKEKNCHDNS